jgi:putative hydrolase of the HAD superfamily
MTFLDEFAVLLLDMNGTFLFDHDRFGPEQDYFATYRRLGGDRLTREQLLAVWKPSLSSLLVSYETPANFDDFPTLAEVFAAHGASTTDIPLLERVFAAHEIGTVPAAHEAFLTDVSRTHALGVVSNICAHPDLWLQTCASADVFTVFRTLVFSSEGRHIKPSSEIFARALAQFPTTGPILFVGDSLERDIIPAKALGLATAWIAPSGSAHAAADIVVSSLPELARVNSRGHDHTLRIQR